VKATVPAAPPLGALQDPEWKARSARMKILLIYKYYEQRPPTRNWPFGRLVSSLSAAGHEVMSTWWVVSGETKERLESAMAAVVMSTEEFRAYDPDLLLIDGSPDHASPRDGAFDRKLPWSLEEEFRGSGGGIFFFAAKPDQNFEEPNAGYAEYGFPLSQSTEPYISRSGTDDHVPAQSRRAGYLSESRRAGRPIHLKGEGGYVRFTDWSPPSGLPMPGGRNHLDEVVIIGPWVLDRRASVAGAPLFMAGWCCVAVWRDDPSPMVLMTGSAFTDFAIELGQNEEMLHILVNGMALGIAVQRPGVLPPALG
jgi:hypothetical protein